MVSAILSNNPTLRNNQCVYSKYFKILSSGKTWSVFVAYRFYTISKIV
jgi:hypothetical protein